MTWHAQGFEKPEDAEADRAKLEVPPVGYKGDLHGTVWAEDNILDGYDQRGEGVG